MAKFALNLVSAAAALAAANAAQADATQALSDAAAAQSDADTAITNAATADGKAVANATALLTGPGLPFKLAPTGTMAPGDGTELYTPNLTLPSGYSPTNGDKIGISGQIFVRSANGDADDGKSVATVNVRDMILMRAAGEWTVESIGSAEVSDSTDSLDRTDYYATDAALPCINAAAGELQLGHTPITGVFVELEADFTLRFLGANTA